MKNKICVNILIMLLANLALGANLSDVTTKWLDTENKETTISGTVSGTYSLITMVYTNCAHACPMIIAKAQKVMNDFNKQDIKDIRVILASFDVKNDRPEKLKKYQIEKDLDTKTWKFLSAANDQAARELAVILGISYKDLGDGDFSHSNVIALLAPNGEMLATIDNLNASSDSLIEAYKAHLKKTLGK